MVKQCSKMGPQIEQLLVQFWVHFGSILGSVLESVLGLKWAKMRQDDSNEDIKRLKVPRSIIFKKCDFIMGKPYFLRLGGSQEEYERFRKAPKRHLKSFKTSKEKVPKMEPKNSFWTNFGAEMDSEMESPKNRKLDQKWNRNWNCIWRTEMGMENANTVNCRCRCRYKSCQMNKRKEYATTTPGTLQHTSLLVP